MKTVRLRPRLGILFVLAVCLPSAALVVMAVRSIAGEEAVLEKRLERTFTAELDHVVALVAETMDEAIGELAGSAPVDTGPRGRAALAAWAASSDLVGVPFLLTADDRLVEPSPDRELTGDEIAFLRWNEEFLAGSVQTPVYYNVGVAYQQEILAAAADTAGAGAGGAAAEAEADATAAAASTTAAGEPATIPADAQLTAAAETRATAAGAPAAGAGAAAVVPAAADELASARREQLPAAAQTPPAAAQKTAAATASTPPPAAVPSTLPASTPAPTADTAAPPAANSPAAVQEAVNLYKQDESVRKRVLEKALSEGATPVERLVQPRASQPADDAAPADKAAKDAERPSIFVTRQRTFKEIQADATSGLLPRVVQDELELLFWVRTADGGTAGCVVDLAQLSARLVARLPDPFTGERILTLLDDRAEPLATPPDGRTLDWRRPFVALELHESLPRWEVASYLADPGLFASQVRLRTSLLWLLVAILVASIGGGGAFVFLGLGHELQAAQQRTTFVANVSHELKTPLTSIRMFAEMLRDGRQADPGRRQRYLDLMVAETGRLTRLVNNVLDFSQLEQGRKRYARRAVDLGELCRGVVDVERPRLEQAGFAVGFAPASEPLRVTADEDALRQVLGNLLSNAEKYSADHREVAVEAGTRDGRPFFAVLDRGIGVAPEHAARIFREFYRVDDSLTARVKGTGLGLSIARRIVRDHGGELTYEPREGGGSVFRAAFPAAGAPPGRGGRRPARPRKAGRDGG